MPVAHVEQALIAHLLGDATTTNIVGTRIYLEPMPEGVELPALSLKRISTLRRWHHGGAANLPQAVTEIQCFGTNDTEAAALTNAVRALLDGFTGNLDDGGPNELAVSSIFVIDERGTPEDDTKVKMWTLEISSQWRQT
jgi:hypothetical protein